MTNERWLLILALLGVLAVKIGTLEHGWHEALTPQFIGATVGEVVIALRLMVSKDKADKAS
jgi:hypothetical protein